MQMMKTAVILLLCIGSSVPDLLPRPAVVINEVLANAPGTDSGSGTPGDRFEFIELYNAGNEPVDLAGWSFDDGDASDELLAWQGSPVPWVGALTGSTVLPAGEFVLVLDPENVIPEPAFPYDVPDSVLAVTVGNTTLGDGLSTTDPVTLYGPDGRVVDTFGTPGLDDDFPFDPGDGVSLERKDPDAGDDASNWAPSIASAGATPGIANSVTRSVDAMIPGGTLLPSGTRAKPGEAVEIRCPVLNFGREGLSGCRVCFSAAAGLHPPFGEVAPFDTVVIDGVLASGDSTTASTSWMSSPTGLYSVMAVVRADGDEYPENDSAFVRVRVGDPLSPVVVNEIYAWRSDDEPQWVEIFNAGTELTDIGGWGLRDEGGSTGTLPPGLFFLPGGAYLVLVPDADEFVLCWGSVPSFGFAELSGFPVFNRNGDSVVLCDGGGTVIDSVRYGGAPEDGVGVSWERVSPGVHSFLSENWARSLDTGGTPGKRNSVAMDRIPSRGRLSFTPPVITPDGDGRNDRTTISYRVPSLSSDLTLKVFDSTGREVAVLVEGLRTAGEGSFIWDGRGRDGRILPTGLYIVLLVSRNPPSGEEFVCKRSLVLAPRF